MSAEAEFHKQWCTILSQKGNREVAELTDAGLLIGAETCLFKGRQEIETQYETNRLVKLLKIFCRGEISERRVSNIKKATELWQRGQKVLANIHLAFAQLPRLESIEDSYRIFLADVAISFAPAHEILDGDDTDDRRSRMLRFDPDQARVAAGSGRRAGEWTKNGGETGEGRKNHQAIPANRHGYTSGTSSAVTRAFEDSCEARYEIDLARCRILKNRFCYAQAMERYAACLAGRPIPPFPY